jgi:hypothetical protein
MDLKKLTTKRLLAYYRSHRKTCLSLYEHGTIMNGNDPVVDENGENVIGWTIGYCSNNDLFIKDIALLTNIKDELNTREHLIKEVKIK